MAKKKLALGENMDEMFNGTPASALDAAHGVRRIAPEREDKKPKRPSALTTVRMYTDQLKWIRRKAFELADEAGERPDASEIYRKAFEKLIAEGWEP